MFHTERVLPESGREKVKCVFRREKCISHEIATRGCARARALEPARQGQQTTSRLFPTSEKSEHAMRFAEDPWERARLEQEILNCFLWLFTQLIGVAPLARALCYHNFLINFDSLSALQQRAD